MLAPVLHRDVDQFPPRQAHAPDDPRQPRRRALLIPGFFALLSFVSWIAAALIWSVLWPSMVGEFAPIRALRQGFAMVFVAGPIVAAIVFFSVERVWRAELPHVPSFLLGRWYDRRNRFAEARSFRREPCLYLRPRDVRSVAKFQSLLKWSDRG